MRPLRLDFKPERANKRLVRSDLFTERADLRPERPDLSLERLNLRPERPDFRPARPDRGNKRTNKWTDCRQADDSPPVFYRT